MTAHTTRRIGTSLIIAIAAFSLLAATPTASAGGRPGASHWRAKNVHAYARASKRVKTIHTHVSIPKTVVFKSGPVKFSVGKHKVNRRAARYNRGFRAGANQGWTQGYRDGKRNDYNCQAPCPGQRSPAYVRGFNTGFDKSYDAGFGKGKRSRVVKRRVLCYR